MPSAWRHEHEEGAFQQAHHLRFLPSDIGLRPTLRGMPQPSRSTDCGISRAHFYVFGQPVRQPKRGKERGEPAEKWASQRLARPLAQTHALTLAVSRLAKLVAESDARAQRGRGSARRRRPARTKLGVTEAERDSVL